MSYRKFNRWCNDRACDGCWDMLSAIICIYIVKKMKKIPFWKREKVWKLKYEKKVLSEIVEPIEAKIKELSLQEKI